MDSSIFDTLVTDRTASDTLLKNEKGTYRASDQNRVETAVEYLSDSMIHFPLWLKEYAAAQMVAWGGVYELPYETDGLPLNTKTDWGMLDIFTESDASRYLGNVFLLARKLKVDFGSIPQTMDRLTFQGANEIETVLRQAKLAFDGLKVNYQKRVDNTAAAFVYSGQITCGGGF